MDAGNLISMLNISSILLSFDSEISVATITNMEPNRTVARNVASNAYEWRFILPPYFLIFMLSICGNCMVIATLASNKRMRTITNVYLMNLAISDFMLGVFCLPFTLVGQIYRQFLFGAVMCKLIPFLQAVSVSVDVWTLVAISLERYFAICKSLKSRKWQTQCHAYKMIAVVWLMSIALNSPILIASTLQPMSGNAYKCREIWPSLEMERAFNLGLDAVLLLIPIFLMSFAYSLIVTKLWRGMRYEIKHNFHLKRQLAEKPKRKESQLTTATTPILCGHSTELCCKPNCLAKKKEAESRLPREPKTGACFIKPGEPKDFRYVVRSTNIDKSIEAKRKVIRMLFVIILEFFICWTPLHVINTIYLFYPEALYQYVGSKGIVSLQLLAYCSSFSNPITYCFMNRKFRQAFVNLIMNCKLVRMCSPAKSESKTAAPQLSSQDATAGVIRGSQTGRTDKTPVEHQPYEYYKIMELKLLRKLCLLAELGSAGTALSAVYIEFRAYIDDASWMDSKPRNAFSSGSQANSSSGNHPALPAPAVITRPITQVIEKGEEGSQFLYRIKWARNGAPKGTSQSQPRYE